MARLLLCFLIVPLMCLHGQAPNPSAAGLDWVQQSFPVEAARILAYARNAADGKIATVSVSVERADATGAAWKVSWLDAAGKPIRERTVTVANSRIEEGAAFYRDVFQQLAGEDWAIKSAPPDNSATAYWQGAELGAVSRTEAITAANKLVADKPRLERAADAARLAGVLIHAATPSLAGRRPVDARLLSRGAAWLCICEKRLHEPLAAGWAPVLFLAGRESEARDLWQSPEAVIKMRTVPERFWAMALTKGSVEEAFIFAARRENRSWALPALCLHWRKDSRLTAPSRELVDSLDRELATRSHDYTPLVSDRAASDAAWQRLKKEFPDPAANPAGLNPLAHFSASDLSDLGSPGSVAPPGRIADLTDDQLATLVKDAIASAAAAPEPVSAQTAATPGSGTPARDPLGPPPPMTTADETWSYLETLKAGPGPAGSPEDGLRRMRAWLDRRRTTAEQFVAKYPQDPRRWEAVTIGVEAAIRQRQYDQGQGKDDCQKLLDEVIAAPGATREVKGNAAFLRIVLDLSDVNGSERHTLPPFHRKLTEFQEAYADHPRAVEAAGLQMQLLESGETPGADKILEKLSQHTNRQIADQAKRLLDQRARFVELKKKPLELQFTAADGTAVDFTKLRGKVVLLDFWASWCGPCMAEAPNVVAAYKKLHERGFEIIGICLDQDKAAMTGAIERAGLTWPHHFDGKGWGNEIAQRFGIRSIPSTWLFDKEGKLRTTGLRGQELEAGVERLLRE